MIGFFTAIISFIIDLKSKEHIMKNFKLGITKNVLGDCIKIKHTKNRGLMLGKLKDRQKIVKGMNIIGVIALFVVLFITLFKKVNIFSQIGLGLLVGGGAGNLYDRFKYGEVTDFIIFKFLSKVIFNIADIFIILGSFIIFIVELVKN